MAHQAGIDREDYAHPEKIYKDLMSKTDGQFSEADQKKIKEFVFRPSDRTKEELCWSCGWTTLNQTTSSYSSRVRIFHTRNNMGLWEVGSRWVIRDRPNDHTIGNDFMAQEFLRSQLDLDLPLLKEMRKLSLPTDKVELTLMSRAEGVSLDKIWHTLSLEQKLLYKDQLGDAITKWRQFTSPVARKVNGDLLDDCLIGYCLHRTAPTCKKMGRTTDEWLANLEADLRFGLSRIHKTKDPLIIDAEYPKLKRNFPKSEPYVLSHVDLNMTNIIVKDGKIEAIIDWEYAGYFPWWTERWMSLIGGDDISDELFDPLWDDSRFGWEMDTDTFQTEVIEKIAPVLIAWEECSFNTRHANTGTRWVRPGFCNCKPFAGAIRCRDIGLQTQHKLTPETRQKFQFDVDR